jgi:opacity protein-like surface antigen
MKNIIQTCFAFAMISPLLAGDYETSPSSSPSDAPSYGATSWFVGGGADYMFDELEELYWYGQVGYKLSAQSALFLEAGWIGSEEDASFQGVSVSADLDIVPITLNYSYEFAFTDKLSMYLGGGLGTAYSELEGSASGFGTSISSSQDDWVFMLQCFSGLIYEFTPNFEGYAGLRYMWLDDPLGVELDDWGVGAGVRFHF